ncbi:hypothetical protein NW762_001541 [Fusarium torreyae]|uniref:Proline dehydrogenase n=1 Tax=Fusarium torreyae TaxID=1237075 RepID=A0A9W8VLM6_9HYPO|nr:hypothetical protein NW762_001541 [Fusarium torreyae]
MLLRSLLVATVSNNRALLTPSLSLLSFFAKPHSGLLSVEKNPLLHFLFKRTLYDHFCAGENGKEVTGTINRIKDMGFKGVILTYAKEVVVDSSQGGGSSIQGSAEIAADAIDVAEDSAIEAWRQGVLETVQMIGEGDFLALKFTGAGKSVTDALISGDALPVQMTRAIHEICNETLKRRASVLVDAEQQFVQHSIDKVALDLMEKYNIDGHATVYNTYQAYLKSTPDTLYEHLQLAKKNNYTIGVKLVRGAYINTEPRHLINDTKQDTDDSYDLMARGLMETDYRDLKRTSDGEGFPKLGLFLATHNKASVLKAFELQKSRTEAGLPLIKVQYGQLLGMADEVSCTLLQLGGKGAEGATSAPPEAYKCLSWGTLGDCLSYLLRRAVENRDAVSRTRTEYEALKKEAWRRLRRIFT